MKALLDQAPELAVVNAPRAWPYQSQIHEAAAVSGFNANVLPGISVAQTHLHRGVGAVLIVPRPSAVAVPRLLRGRAERAQERALDDYTARARRLGVPVGTLVMEKLDTYSAWRFTITESPSETPDQDNLVLTEWLGRLRNPHQA